MNDFRGHAGTIIGRGSTGWHVTTELAPMQLTPIYSCLHIPLKGGRLTDDRTVSLRRMDGTCNLDKRLPGDRSLAPGDRGLVLVVRLLAHTVGSATQSSSLKIIQSLGLVGDITAQERKHIPLTTYT